MRKRSLVPYERPVPVLPAAVWFFALGLAFAPPAAALLPVPTDCVVDVGGANDAVGQRDVTLYCNNAGDGSPFELNTISNLDITSLPGMGQSADVCQLFDTDGDAFANLAVCVKTHSLHAGDPLTLQMLALYTCTNAKADRCTGPALVPGPYNTQCEVTQENTDPFPGPAPGPGDDYDLDTRILCGIDLDDFGPAGIGANVMDSCSYESDNPNTNPGDCTLFAECTSDPHCDDGNSCTADSCDVSNVCVHTPIPGAPCSDGLFCNGEEVCTALGLCGVGSGTPVDCNDGVSCTLDTCDELGDVCENDPRSSLCSDNLFCTGAETCDPLAGCQAGVPPDCSDGIACTTDACDEAGATCTHDPSDAACDDNLFCNGSETCSAASGCQPGTPPDCADAVDCTTDSCNEAADRCDHVANDAVCNDHLFCDGAETCDVLLGCQAGTAPDCTDTVGCTDDACNETTDQCDHTPDNASCSDGEFCTGVEICDPATGCSPGADPCPGAKCNEATDVCVECMTDADCDNSVFCDGPEVCTAGICGPGTPPDCDDGVGCTTDRCNETTNVCDNIPSNAACDNGLYCDGAETCDAAKDCVPGVAPDCSDGVGCTVDACVEASDSCSHTADNSLCNDGLFCDGVETCNATVGCVPGTPVACGDAFACTIDSCNENTDLCEHSYANCVCGDGEVTGTEQCDPPAPAGTYEDCNDNIDNDGDGKVDCRDRDCKPGARPDICDENCTMDKVCSRISRDPSRITYSTDGGPDEFYIHGRIPMTVDKLRSAVHALTLELSNERGPVYRASLDDGDLRGGIAGKRFRFQDATASILGVDGVRGGLEEVRVHTRRFAGVRYLVFTIRAYGDFSKANRRLMTSEISVGTEVGFLTAEWIANRTGWLLHQRDF